MIRVLAGVLLSVVLTGPVLAVPAPLSPEKLAQKSDVIATVRILGVACTGTAPTTTGPVNTYQAWAQVVVVMKGDVKKNETLLISWQDLPRGLIGGWKVEYYPGEVVPTHLRWVPETRSYTSTWWNARGKPAMPVKKSLPDQPGAIKGGL